MASLLRVLVAAGLLVVAVTAAPQQQPFHPLRDTYSPSTHRESSVTTHSFTASHDTDDGDESIHNIDEDTGSESEEGPGTHYRGNTNGEAANPQQFNHNPFSSFGTGSQRAHGVSVYEGVHGTQNEDNIDGETTTTQRYGYNPLSSFGTGSRRAHGETVTTTDNTQHVNYSPYSSFGSSDHQTRSETLPFDQDDVTSHSSAYNPDLGHDTLRTYDPYGPTFGRYRQF